MNEKRYLRYSPSLNKVTGSMLATIVMLQLEYWFEKVEKKQFYKFLEPCNHEFYQVGDSWTEELGISKAEFRTAFAKIGKVYKSKRTFLEAEDKFGGKLYLSYYDRMKKLTYYIRNDVKVRPIMFHWQYDEDQSMKEGSAKIINYGVSNKVGNIVSEPQELTESAKLSHAHNNPCVTQVREADLHRCENELEVSVDYVIPYQEITTCFNNTCASYPKVNELTPRIKRLIKALWATGKVSLKVIQEVFCLAEQSDFLSGRTGSTWRATLEWLLRPDKFELVLGGKYSGRSRASSIAMPFKQQRFNNIAMHDWDLEALQRQENKYIESKVQALRADTEFVARLAKYRGCIAAS